MEMKPVKIEGTLFWAFLNRKNELSDAYSVDIGNLDDGDVAKLKSIGINPKFNVNKPEMGHYITCKSKNYPIKAYEINGDELDEDIAVGNGSKAKALVGVYEWKFKGKSGVSPSIKKLVVTELIEYKREVTMDEDDDL